MLSEIFKSCDHIQDATNLSKTCKRFRIIWQQNKLSIGKAVLPKMPCYSDACILADEEILQNERDALFRSLFVHPPERKIIRCPEYARMRGLVSHQREAEWLSSFITRKSLPLWACNNTCPSGICRTHPPGLLPHENIRILHIYYFLKICELFYWCPVSLAAFNRIAGACEVMSAHELGLMVDFFREVIYSTDPELGQRFGTHYPAHKFLPHWECIAGSIKHAYSDALRRLGELERRQRNTCLRSSPFPHVFSSGTIFREDTWSD